MSKQVWICEKCGSQWNTEEAAKTCEDIHKTPSKFMVLSWVPYDPQRWRTPYERAFPQRIKVELDLHSPLEGWNYATYVLERVGPRGC